MIKYILLVILFFSCQKGIIEQNTTDNQTDSVTLIQEEGRWVIIAKIEKPVSYIRTVTVETQHPDQTIHSLLMFQPGNVEIRSKLPTSYGAVLSFKVVRWGVFTRL